jgi:hypothetical protein
VAQRVPVMVPRALVMVPRALVMVPRALVMVLRALVTTLRVLTMMPRVRMLPRMLAGQALVELPLALAEAAAVSATRRPPARVCRSNTSP